jgi:FG-GAP repeat protein
MDSRKKIAAALELLAATGLALGGFAAQAQAQLLRFSLPGDQAGAKAGYVSCGGGDVDGDGIADFAVGMPEEDYGGSMFGKVTVFSGASGLPIRVILSPTGQPAAGFGSALAIDGDFDGDGIADVLVGAPHEMDTQRAGEDNGCVRVFSGATGLLLYEQYGQSLDELGTSVDFVGDIGDHGHPQGSDDFAAGAPVTSVRPGYVELVGKYGLLWTAQGQSPTTGFGTSVRAAGDVDGDGVPDVVVGEPWFDRISKGLPLHDCGRVLVFSGASSSEIWEVSGWDGDWLGWSVGSLGDVNGDGHADIIAGAPYEFGTGGVMGIDGASSFQLFTIAGDGAGDLFGWSVAGLRGDISGDGIPDFVVGAPGFDPSDSSNLASGYARTFSGKDGTAFHTYVPSSVMAGDYGYGMSVSGGDIDGDGVADFVVGFPAYDTLGTQSGLIDVWKGCPASWDNYGAGWPGTNNVIPSFTIAGDVTPGGSITLSIGNSAGTTTTGFLYTGIQSASIPTNLGGTLLVSPLFTLPLGIPAAGLSMTGSIPNGSSLYCTSIYLQALELDSGASKGVSFTPGVHLHIGYLYP